MARQARKFSSSGIYHVVNKGTGNQIIFEEDTDYQIFIDFMTSCKKKFNIKILAYCLMDNHFHLLVLDIDHNLSNFMKKLEESYAMYFNQYHKRCGHFFANRFKSETVEDDQYFTNVLQYILKNPQKAGIENYKKYKWSSYKDYFYHSTTSITDTYYVENLLENIEKFFIVLEQNIENIKFLDYESRGIFRVIDTMAIQFIHKKLKISSCSLIQSFNKKKRNTIISILKSKGLSIRQIERLTGIGKGIIQRI